MWSVTKQNIAIRLCLSLARIFCSVVLCYHLFIFQIFQVPPSLLNEDMLKIPHSIEESVMEGIKGIKKMYEHEESKKRIGTKLSKMVYIFPTFSILYYEFWWLRFPVSLKYLMTVLDIYLLVHTLNYYPHNWPPPIFQFCVTLVAIVGNYRGSCRFDNTRSKTFSFDHDHFLQSRPANLQDCVAKLLQCQHFDEFIQVFYNSISRTCLLFLYFLTDFSLRWKIVLELQQIFWSFQRTVIES